MPNALRRRPKWRNSICQIALAGSTSAEVTTYDLRIAEAQLSRLVTQRRKDKVLNPVVGRLKADLRYVFKHEEARVLDLLRHQVIPYTPARESFESDRLLQVILNGVDIGQYQAVFEDAYRETMPGAMDATVRLVLDGIEYKYRVNSLGEVFLASGVKLVRFRSAENWIRDHAIQFSRRWAPKVTATTNKAIRAQLAQGMERFEGMDGLIARVKSVYADASAFRAEAIARNQTSLAYGSASVETAQRLGLAGKYWIQSGSPYSFVDVCADNANMGTIPVYASFYDLDGNPILSEPAHINCECSVGYDVADDWQIPGDFMETA